MVGTSGLPGPTVTGRAREVGEWRGRVVLNQSFAATPRVSVDLVCLCGDEEGPFLRCQKKQSRAVPAAKPFFARHPFIATEHRCTFESSPASTILSENHLAARIPTDVQPVKNLEGKLRRTSNGEET